MRYLLCLLPPVAVILSSRNPLLWILSVPLTVAGYVPGVIFALLIVNRRYSKRQHKATLKAISRGERHGR